MTALLNWSRTWLFTSVGPSSQFIKGLSCLLWRKSTMPRPVGVLYRKVVQLALLLHNIFVFPNNREVKQLVVKCVHQNNRLVNLAGSVVGTKNSSWFYS